MLKQKFSTVIKRSRTEAEKRKACTQLRAGMPTKPLACASLRAFHRLLVAMIQAHREAHLQEVCEVKGTKNSDPLQ